MGSPRIRRRRRAPALAAIALLAAAGACSFGESGAGRTPDATRLASARPIDGEALYRVQCAACHGLRGAGEADWKSQRADGTYPAPPHDPSGHTWHHADGLLFRIVRDGGQVGAPVGFKSAMPGWRGTLTDPEIVAVLEHIKTLWGPAERQSQARLSVQDPYPR